MVCHKCDVTLCINPDHLFVGTAKDNMQDMISKGRAAPQDGSNNGASKIDRRQAQQIMGMIQMGMNNTEIAEHFPLTHSQISSIRLGKSWKEAAYEIGFCHEAANDETTPVSKQTLLDRHLK